ncbi:hypothetical protein [Hymenobacter sp.]|uniref:hypothetical protein n=1 Tax=Hymenobacter sp. TaxID=1898978 RepID=UPI00286B686C|nr:hypothetical protein [Hymenobacter sp.]
MKASFKPVNHGRPRPNDPGTAGRGGAVGPAALGAGREADATVAADGGAYAPAVALAGGLPHPPPVSAEAR